MPSNRKAKVGPAGTGPLSILPKKTIMKFKDKKPFSRTILDEEKRRDTFTVSVNEEERTLLENCKKILEQEKDSTALKQLAWIGAKIIHEEKIAYILGTVFDNKRKNKRIGIIEFET